MTDTTDPVKVELALTPEIESAGGILRKSKSGRVLSIDFRHSSYPVTDELVKKFPTFERLKELFLNDTDISDDCLPYILQLERLKTLNLDGTQISDTHMDLLARHPNLQLLSLNNTGVSADIIAGMRKKMIGTRIVFR